MWVELRSVNLRSEVLPREDAVALSEHLVAFLPQMVFLPQIAHIEYFLVVLLQQATSRNEYRGEM